MPKKIYKISSIWASLNSYIKDYEELLKNIKSDCFYVQKKLIEDKKEYAWTLIEKNGDIKLPFRKEESPYRTRSWVLEMLSIWVTFGFVEISSNNGKYLAKKKDLLNSEYKINVKNYFRKSIINNFLINKKRLINDFLELDENSSIEELENNIKLWNYKNEYSILSSLFIISLYEKNHIDKSEIIYGNELSFNRWLKSKIPFNNEWYELAKQFLDHKPIMKVVLATKDEIDEHNIESNKKTKNNKITANLVQTNPNFSIVDNTILKPFPKIIENYEFKINKKDLEDKVSSSSITILNFVERYITKNEDLSLKIPIYQRNYIWGKTIFNKFYNDIFLLALNPSISNLQNYHYIGEIALSEGNERNLKDTYNVVDGQQRITSILLVLHAIFYYSKNNGIVIDNTTKKLFEKNKDGIYLANNKFKHIKGNINFYVLDKILTGRATGILNLKEKQTFVYKNYLNIVQYLEKAKYDQRQIKQILETLYTKIVFTEIIHTTNEEYQLFENLNSNKALLKNIDLIKNFIIMRVEDIEINEKEEKILYIFEKLILEPFKKKTKIDLFLTVYSKLYLIKNYGSLDIKKLGIIENTKGINDSQNILPTFKWIIKQQIDKIIEKDKNKMSFTNYEELIMKINKKIKLFMMIFDKEEYYNRNNDIFKLHDILSIFDDRTVYIPTIMFLVSNFSEYDEKLIIAHSQTKRIRGLLFALEKFEVIFKIVEYKNESFSTLIDKILEKINEEYLIKNDQLNHYDILKVLEKAKTKYPWNEININLFYNELISEKKLTDQMIYNLCRRVEYFLDNKSSLEWDKNRKNWTDDIKKPSIEHIMPQTLSKTWINYLIKDLNLSEQEIKMEHQKSLNKLGNLMVINGNENTSFSNKDFDKKDYIKTNVSSLYQFNGTQNQTTKLTSLEQYKKWDFEAINKRTKELANILYYIYKEVKW